MNTIPGVRYPLFIRNAIREMQIQPGDNILVFGAGAGRNMDLMDKYISGKGRIVGLDVGPEMLGVSPTPFHRSSLHYHRKITD